MPDPLVRINNNIHSWNSTLFQIASRREEKVTSIALGDKITRAIIHAMRRDGRPIGKTAGKFEADQVVVKFLMDIWPLVEFTISDGLGSSGNTVFPMLLQFVEVGNIPITIQMKECSLIGRKLGHDEGVEASVMEATFDCLGIEINGIALYSQIGRGFL